MLLHVLQLPLPLVFFWISEMLIQHLINILDSTNHEIYVTFCAVKHFSSVPVSSTALCSLLLA
jgi:hypothetical protein